MADAELNILIKAKNEASKTLKEVDSATQQLSKNLKIAGVSMIGVGAGIVAMMGAAAKSAAEEEVGIIRLSQAMQNVGLSYDASRSSLEAWIDSEQQKTAIADSDQRESLASLILMTGNLKDAQDLLTLAMDVARGTGRDLAGATQLIQYAYAGNWGMLERYIPAIKQAANEEEKWRLLRELFMGQAEEYGKSTAGQFELLKNNIGDIKETIGGFVAEALLPLIEHVQGILQGIKAWAEEHPELARTITRVVLVVGALLVPLGTLLIMLPLLISGWKALTGLLSISTVKTIAHTAATIAHSVAMGAAKIALLAATAAQWALNVAMSANPIGLIILAIAGLIALIVALVKNWDKVKAAFGRVWDWIVDKFRKVIDFFRGIPAFFKELGIKIANFFIAPIRWMVNKVLDGINWIIRQLNKLPGINISEITWRLPELKLEALQHGGIVTKPTVALLGERGAEAVIPLNKAGALSPVVINNYIDTLVVREEADIDKIAEALYWKYHLRARAATL